MTIKHFRYLNLIVSFSSLFCCFLTIIFVANRDMTGSQNHTQYMDMSYTNTVYGICKEMIDKAVIVSGSNDIVTNSVNMVVVGKAWQCGDWYCKMGGRIYKVGDRYRDRVITDIELGAIALDGSWCSLVAPAPEPENKETVSVGNHSAAGGGDLLGFSRK